MAIIGTFTKADEKFSGELKTLSLKAKISIVPTALDGENTPDFRVMAGTTEIGKGKDYVSLKLDDPTFAAPVYANLVERQDKHVLIWNR